jgi:hypothetical protein
VLKTAFLVKKLKKQRFFDFYECDLLVPLGTSLFGHFFAHARHGDVLSAILPVFKNSPNFRKIKSDKFFASLSTKVTRGTQPPVFAVFRPFFYRPCYKTLFLSTFFFEKIMSFRGFATNWCFWQK